MKHLLKNFVANFVEHFVGIRNSRPHFISLLGCTFLLAPAAPAFPPAPDHVLFGMVRNQWGDPLDVSSAIVFLETPTGAGVKVSVLPGLEPGVNYRLAVPMD